MNISKRYRSYSNLFHRTSFSIANAMKGFVEWRKVASFCLFTIWKAIQIFQKCVIEHWHFLAEWFISNVFRVEHDWKIMVRFMKWSFQDDFVETALGAVLRTPGLILCDYWHQKCLEYSIPKSLEFTDFTDASLHLAVLLMVRLDNDIRGWHFWWNISFV